LPKGLIVPMMVSFLGFSPRRGNGFLRTTMSCVKIHHQRLHHSDRRVNFVRLIL
jgi:hypothetical protein